MSEQFKAGEICIGQNFVDFPEYNGAEILIIKGLAWRGGFNDSDLRYMEWNCYIVDAGDGSGPFQCSPAHLRRKRPPTTGEDKIIALFNAPPVEHRQPVTAWQAQYDTAQALMKMGVRVKPGKWLVEAV